MLAAALIVPGVASATPTEPTADLPGSRDNALLKRFQGSFIVSYEHKSLGEFALPLAPLEKGLPGCRNIGDSRSAYVCAPKQTKDVVGEYTRLLYVLPPEHSPFEVSKNYADEVTRQGGNILFRCAGAECGGDETRGSDYGYASFSSLSMHLYPSATFTDKQGTLASCLMAAPIADRRYFAAQINSGAHVSVYTYTVGPDACDGVTPNRTIALVQIIGGDQKPDNQMVTVGATQLADSISKEGRATVYGIYFDSKQAEIKSESSATLEQIAKLLSDRPSLKVLIVGHTDNIGGYDANVELSQRRAKAVVSELATHYNIAAQRLTPVGVSSASPLDTNKTQSGRAKNRRVEIVAQ